MGNSCVAGAFPSLLEKTSDPDFQLKIYGFSSLLKRGAISANSDFFRCCGYEWFLEMTPMHKKFNFESSYVALRLFLRRNSFEPGYIINAVFELSMYNHSNGTYCGCKASNNFHVMKWYLEKKCLIPLEELLKSSDLLVDDSCVFGVRILKADISSPINKIVVVPKKPVVVPKNPMTVQNIFLQKKEFIKGTYTWTMSNFIDLNVPVLSPAFEVGSYKWHIKMHPCGDQYDTKSVSLYLCLDDPSELALEYGMMIELNLSILDQKHGKHQTTAGRFAFAGKGFWGWPYFIRRWLLKNCYLVGSNCILKADITIIGSSNND